MTLDKFPTSTLIAELKRRGLGVYPLAVKFLTTDLKIYGKRYKKLVATN